jgi:hypothetical protein
MVYDTSFRLKVDNREKFDEVTVLLVTEERTTVSPFTTFGQKTKLQSVYIGFFTLECNMKRSKLIALLTY